MSASEIKTRREWFAGMLEEEASITITLTPALAQMIAAAMCEYMDNRSHYPEDARSYYLTQICRLRRLLPNSFPSVYNED